MDGYTLSISRCSGGDGVEFGFDGDYSLFEDACTDARIFGYGIG